MTYTVVWEPSAEAELAQAWLDAPDRNAVSEASNSIEQQLRLHPWDASEALNDTKRMLVVKPLGIIFEISDEDRLVRVLLLRSFR